MRAIWLTCLAAACLAVPATAHSQEAQTNSTDDITQRIISVPAPSRFIMIGTQGRVRRDEGVQGGSALRIRVPGRSDQPWAISVNVPITRAVRAGDKLVLAFWARLEEGENGGETTVLPFNAVQLASPPYTPLFHGPLTIGHDWRLQEIRGRADRDYPEGALNVAIHLATARQTVDLGPVFVLNMGQPAAN